MGDNGESGVVAALILMGVGFIAFVAILIGAINLLSSYFSRKFPIVLKTESTQPAPLSAETKEIEERLNLGSKLK